jgi:hypothetical protein
MGEISGGARQNPSGALQEPGMKVCMDLPGNLSMLRNTLIIREGALHLTHHSSVCDDRKSVLNTVAHHNKKCVNIDDNVSLIAPSTLPTEFGALFDVQKDAHGHLLPTCTRSLDPKLTWQRDHHAAG